ncbi:MAG: hypothetical protein ABI388_10355 [Bacteroidia bacterium]
MPFYLFAQTRFELVKKVSCFKHPENVCIISSAKILIADIGKTLKSSEMDSDGVIYQCTIDNINAKNKLNKTFKLNAPKGMTLSGNILFIADINRIVVVNIETGLKIDEIVFADTTVSLNDVFLLDDNTLLASVTNQHELYAITIASKEIINLSNNSVYGANGLCKDENKVYICGFSSKENGKGSIYEYDLEHNKTNLIIKDVGHLDGIKLYNKKLLVSDWGADYNHGKIWEVDIKTKQAIIVLEDELLQSPSGFDLLGDTLILPCLDDGDVLVYKLK